MNKFWQQLYFNNSVKDWLTVVVLVAGGFLAIALFKRIILNRLKKWSARTETDLDDLVIDALEHALVPLAYVIIVYASLQTLALARKADQLIHIAFLFSVTFYVLRVLTAVTRQFIFSFIDKQEDRETKAKQARGLILILNFVIWILGIVFLIDNLGYDVTTLVTGLGIGGIAIALAAQTILGDLFSYFIIFFDRPFEIGDFIVTGDKMGTIEYVGIKTTRIRTLSGEQLICSNTFLTNAQVHNFKRMQERRIVFKLGVIYQTDYEQVKRIPALVRSIIEAGSAIRFDRGHFSGFGPSSLDFEFVYYVLSPDYNFYMDKQQDIALAIFKAFEDEGIEFAYPTQTLYLTREEHPTNRVPSDDVR